jgi:tetratricopeptide (TPR) repeat protein
MLMVIKCADLIATTGLMLIAACLCGSISNAQVPAETPIVRSHVERFSTPEARAARIEREAGAKLSAKPDDAETLNERAVARMRLNKFQEAFEDLRKAADLNPGNAEYWANLGYILWKLGRGSEAIETERQALKLDEKNYTANYQLGRFLLRSGNSGSLPEAIAKLKRALELDPRLYEVRFELLAAFRETGDTAAALGQLDVLQEALPSDARVNYVAGLIYVDRNDVKAAIDSFREALRKDPNLDGALQDLGLAYIKLNDWNSAAQAFAELSVRQANSSVAAYFHALSLYNVQKVPDAEKEARRALRLDAGSADALTLLGIIMASQGNADAEAIDLLTQAIAVDAKNFDAAYNLGRLQYLNRDFAGAVKSLSAAVELKAANAEARFFLGTAYEANGDTDAAGREYQELIKLDRSSAYGQIGLGSMFLKQGKIDEAIIALNRAILLNKNNFEANWALGRALFLKESFPEALDALQRAVALAPNRTDARYQLALVLKRLGKNAEAAKEFGTVEKLNKEFREGKPL